MVGSLRQAKGSLFCSKLCLVTPHSNYTGKKELELWFSNGYLQKKKTAITGLLKK